MKKRTIIIIIVFFVIFWVLFFTVKIFGQVCPDNFAPTKIFFLNTLDFNPKFQGPALNLFFAEFPEAPSIREWGALLSLRWQFNTLQIGGYVGGAIVQVDDLVTEPGTNHLGRVTREGGFISLQNDQKRFLYFDLEGRIGHMWQVRPGDSVPRGFHRIESEIQLKAGVRIQGKESLAIPSLNLGVRHLARGGPYGGVKPFLGVSVAYSQR